MARPEGVEAPLEAPMARAPGTARSGLRRGCEAHRSCVTAAAMPSVLTPWNSETMGWAPAVCAFCEEDAAGDATEVVAASALVDMVAME